MKTKKKTPNYVIKYSKDKSVEIHQENDRFKTVITLNSKIVNEIIKNITKIGKEHKEINQLVFD